MSGIVGAGSVRSPDAERPAEREGGPEIAWTLLVVAALIVAMVGMALAPSVRRGLLRVVSGDPVAVSWHVDTGAPALLLEIRAVRAAAPIDLVALLVERRLADRLGMEPPAGLGTGPPGRTGGGTTGDAGPGRRGRPGRPRRSLGSRRSRRDQAPALSGAALLPADLSASDWVAWNGWVPLEPGGTTRLEIGCDRVTKAAGRLVLVYRYRSVLSPMSSSAFVDVEVPGAGPADPRCRTKGAPGPTCRGNPG